MSGPTFPWPSAFSFSSTAPLAAAAAAAVVPFTANPNGLMFSAGGGKKQERKQQNDDDGDDATDETTPTPEEMMARVDQRDVKRLLKVQNEIKTLQSKISTLRTVAKQQEETIAKQMQPKTGMPSFGFDLKGLNSAQYGAGKLVFEMVEERKRMKQANILDALATTLARYRLLPLSMSVPPDSETQKKFMTEFHAEMHSKTQTEAAPPKFVISRDWGKKSKKRKREPSSSSSHKKSSATTTSKPTRRRKLNVAYHFNNTGDDADELVAD